jgi:hypothetical protein
MFDLSNDNSSAHERAILRKLRIWIAALAVACLVAGIGIGAMLVLPKRSQLPLLKLRVVSNPLS